MAARTWGLYQLVLVSWCVGTLAADVFDADTESKVRSFIRETMQCRKVPGMTVAVVKDDATWASGYGTADFDTDRRVNQRTLFNIGSTTKAFTMTLLGILLDEHGYTWSSKVSDVVGSLFTFVDDLRTSQTTIKDLLSHRTGLAALDILAAVPGYSKTATTREKLSRRIRFLPATFEFRDRWHYNNLLYMLLGRIIEILGGDTWENLLKTRLLNPIGMTSSFVLESTRDLQRNNVAKPYIYRDGRFLNGTEELYNIFPFEAAGGIMSSATDMIKWIQFNINGGKTETGVQLLKKHMFDEAIKTTTPWTVGSRSLPQFAVPDTRIGYGYAWFVANYRGYDRYWHSGAYFSYVTYLWIFPDIKLGLYATVNGPAFDSVTALNSIFYYTSDILLAERPLLNETSTCSSLDIETLINETNTCPLPDLEPLLVNQAANTSGEESGHLTGVRDYEGLYGHPLFPDVMVTVRKKNLRLDMGRMSTKLLSTNVKDRFRLEVTGPWELVISFTGRVQFASPCLYLQGGLFDVVFNRVDGVVQSVSFFLEVELTFRKGTSLADPIEFAPGSGALSPFASYFLLTIIHLVSML